MRRCHPKEDTAGLDLTQDAMGLANAMIEPFNRRDFDAMLAMGGGQVDYPDVALGQQITDPDGFRPALQAWVVAFSDLRGTITSAARDGDLLAYEVRFDGTHDGPLQTPMGELPAFGRPCLHPHRVLRSSSGVSRRGGAGTTVTLSACSARSAPHQRRAIRQHKRRRPQGDNSGGQPLAHNRGSRSVRRRCLPPSRRFRGSRPPSSARRLNDAVAGLLLVAVLFR
ncbi:MAG: hypothetical protein QOJ32_2976 [Frankiaceae bacterium]|nr:hypothetical protein [Frankiaceae bacterium]